LAVLAMGDRITITKSSTPDDAAVGVQPRLMK